MTNDWKLAADEMDALKDSGHELDGFVEVKARIAKDFRHEVHLTLNEADFLEVMAAAENAHEDPGDYITKAALDRARADTQTKSKPKRAS